MLDQIKTYLNAILALGLIVGLSYSHWYAYSHGKASGKAEIQTKFDSYKGNINDQVQKSKDEAAIEKQRQDAQYAKAQSDYADASRNLDIALKRLRDIKTVPRDSGLQVAGSSSGSLPSKAEDSSRTTDSASFGAGTFQSAREFYEAAMSDTLQCSKLIEFVKE